MRKKLLKTLCTFKSKYLLTFAISLIASFTMAQAPAFPGAEGHGRYVTGGRGGQVIHVTNLNDSGAGSFRNAVSGSSKKIVVFDVAGVIALKSDINIGANTTILGQTAPAPGITLRYYNVNPNGNNIVMRFIRIRRGQEKNINDGADASTARHYTGIMLDHCSFSWSIDETASFYDNNNFTMQWCTIGESLVHPGHTKGAHGYGGIWGGKLASFHHNLLIHHSNRTPRFNGARYNWSGYTSNKLYNEYKWANTLQAENVDFRNCVIYNCGNGCYGGPGGGYINIVNNYYKTGPAATTNRVTTVTLAADGNAGDDQTFWDMTSRYYVTGNTFANQNGSTNTTPTNDNWGAMNYDSGVISYSGARYTKDPHHYYGDDLTYTKINNVDCLPVKLDTPAPSGSVTTHTASKAYEKVTTYAGASLNPDDVDTRYFNETKNGTCTYKGSATSYVKDGTTYSCTPTWGRIDLVSDVNGYTEENFGTGSREEGFDTDKDGIPDAWEIANGLNPNDATDAVTYTLDPAKFYMNIEVYANSLVQDIMVAGNADAQDAAKEYYPAYKKTDGTAVEAINTLGVDLSGGDSGETGETKTYSVSFNGTDKQSTEGYFSFGDGKHSFNSKFTGKYNDVDFTQGLKMEGTTLVQFTTTAPTSTIIIVQSDWESNEVAHGTPKTIKFDGTELDVSTAAKPEGSEGVLVYTIPGIGTGTHKITRGSGESGIFLVEVRETSTTGISTMRTSEIIATDYYDLNGRRLAEPQRGVNIRVERMANGQVITSKVIK